MSNQFGRSRKDRKEEAGDGEWSMMLRKVYEKTEIGDEVQGAWRETAGPSVENSGQKKVPKRKTDQRGR